jgi:hypothetical protein
MFKALNLFFVGLLVLALSAVAFGQSQASTGQISGVITDANGAVVANASVKAKNKETGLERSVTSSDDGLYTIVLLPTGTYTITAEAPSFAATTIDDVVVNVGRTADANVTMGASAVQATVLVSAEAIQVTRNESDAIVNDTAIRTLPINGRRFQDFVTLTPTAQVDPSRGQISLAGQKGVNGNVTIDGADYNQPFFGGIRGGERSNLAFTVPQEAIKEFQVVATGYSAEFGRSTGGIVNAVTKSGTNSVRGSAFWLYRPSELARGNEFTDALADQRLTALGVALSVAQSRRTRSFTLVPTSNSASALLAKSFSQFRLASPRASLPCPPRNRACWVSITASRWATPKQMMRMPDWGVLIGRSMTVIISTSALVLVRTTRRMRRLVGKQQSTLLPTRPCRAMVTNRTQLAFSLVNW